MRGRSGREYPLALDPAGPGLDVSVPYEFRGRPPEHEVGGRLPERLLDAAREDGLLKTRGRRRHIRRAKRHFAHARRHPRAEPAETDGRNSRLRGVVPCAHTCERMGAGLCRPVSAQHPPASSSPRSCCPGPHPSGMQAPSAGQRRPGSLQAAPQARGSADGPVMRSRWAVSRTLAGSKEQSRSPDRPEAGSTSPGANVTEARMGPCGETTQARAGSRPPRRVRSRTPPIARSRAVRAASMRPSGAGRCRPGVGITR